MNEMTTTSPAPRALPRPLWAAVLAAVALTAAACGNAPDQQPTASLEDGASAAELSGTIEIDGSSTVVPLTDAIAEEYATAQPAVTVNVGFSGTGGGFKRFCAGETDVSNASRPIKPDEAALCAANGIAFTEVRVATDALSVVTSPSTDWVDCLTVDELTQIWRPQRPAMTWDEVRAGFPAEPIAIFAPGADSGTYDFFNEEILDGDIGPRQDFNASEDDNIIVQGIAGTRGSWGFVGYSYTVENADKLKVLAIDGGQGCVTPSEETARSGDYLPLSRPLFIYVKNRSYQRPEVADFVAFYLDNVEEVAPSIDFIAATPAEIDAARAALTGL